MRIAFFYSNWMYKDQIDLYMRFFEKNNISPHQRRIVKDTKNFDIDEAEEIYKENINIIKNCDIFIVDCSYTSSGLGYDISLALQEKKPVIALYNFSMHKDDSRHIRNIPPGLSGNRNKFLFLKEYTEGTIDKILSLAIKDSVVELLETKFNFIISSEIDKYLEWNVRNKNLPKSETMRKSIENTIRNDQEYQNYLKEL